MEVFKQEEVLEESGLKTMDSVSLIHNLKNKQFKNTKMKKFVCTVCGYVHYGEQPPAVCPKCKQPAKVFKEVK